MMGGTVIPPAPSSGLTVGPGRQMSASFANSFRMAAVAERLAAHSRGGQLSETAAAEFFGLCLSLARGIDYAVANSEVPAKVQELPILLKQVCQHRNHLFLQAAIMVLMISVKNACKMGWFSDNETRELCLLADEISNSFCTPGDIIPEPSNSLSKISTIMSRFYPLVNMGQILASIEVKPGYGAYVIDFTISKNSTHSPQEKIIRLFVARTDNTETSACIISPQQVNFLLNGKGVEKRTTALMDPGPQIPTNVTAMLKYGTNLLQAVGQFNGHYMIAVAFMTMMPLAEVPVLPEYVQSSSHYLDQDEDIIEGPSRVSLNCPISYTRIRTPVKGQSCKHLQCFDFSNYVDINSRRPSWRCPNCNRHVCYSDIRVDQNMAKVLKEVGKNVTNVIISADGSWKAVLESDDDLDQAKENSVNCQNEMPEQQSTTSNGLPIFLDLTLEDDKVDAMDVCEIEDRKPFQDTLQTQPLAVNSTVPSQLDNANALNQTVTAQLQDVVVAGGYYSLRSTAAQMVSGISEPTLTDIVTSAVATNAVSSAANYDVGGHGNTNFSPVTQSQVSAPGNLQLQHSQLVNSFANSEYGRSSQIPRHISRTPVAIQALAVPSQTLAPPPRVRANLSTVVPNGSSVSQAAISTVQNWNQQDRSLIQRQVAANRVSSGLQSGSPSLNKQQVPRMPSPPSAIHSTSPLARTQSQQRAQVGVGNSAANTNKQHSRFVVATEQATQLAQMNRQPPSVPVQIPTSRTGAYNPGNADSIRSPTMELRGSVGGAVRTSISTDTLVDAASQLSWRPAGRMRGSLQGRACDSYKEFMIQPTQPTQAQRPPLISTSVPSTVPPSLQAYLSSSRNAFIPQAQNAQMTEPASTNAASGILPSNTPAMPYANRK